MNKNYPCFFICFNILCVHCKQFWGIMRKRGKNENQYLSCFHPPCPARLLSRQKQCRALKVCFSSPIFSQNGKPIVISHQFVSKRKLEFILLCSNGTLLRDPGQDPQGTAWVPLFATDQISLICQKALWIITYVFCRSCCNSAQCFFFVFQCFLKTSEQLDSSLGPFFSQWWLLFRSPFSDRIWFLFGSIRVLF